MADIHPALERYRGIVDDWPAFAEAMTRPLRAALWANPQRVTRDGLVELLAEAGLDPEPLSGLPGAVRLGEGVRPGGGWWYLAGLAHAQEVASQVPVHLLDPRPGERILDLCAAPGGKTSQIAFALENRGTVVANDLSGGRLRALRGNLDRLGLVNVSVTRGDGGNLPRGVGVFDRVLVDAPCSGEGTLRRNAPPPVELGADYSNSLARRQRTLLRKAVQRTRPGGRIVYSTCTFAPEENELVVEAILQEFGGEVVLVPAVLPPEWVSAPGLTDWEGRVLDPSLARCLRLWPHHNDTGGFFIAVLEKRGGRTEAVDEFGLVTPEPDPAWQQALVDRFGIPRGLWEAYTAHRTSRRGLNLVPADHRPPREPRPEASGLFFFRTEALPPKLTTDGAMLLGRHATRNRVELSPDQLEDYLARRDVALSVRARADAVRGYVLVAYRGHTLGVGKLHDGGTLESLFPKRTSGRAELEGG